MVVGTPQGQVLKGPTTASPNWESYPDLRPDLRSELKATPTKQEVAAMFFEKTAEELKKQAGDNPTAFQADQIKKFENQAALAREGKYEPEPAPTTPIGPIDSKEDISIEEAAKAAAMGAGTVAGGLTGMEAQRAALEAMREKGTGRSLDPRLIETLLMLGARGAAADSAKTSYPEGKIPEKEHGGTMYKGHGGTMYEDGGKYYRFGGGNY